MKVVALIPARGGSKGIRAKNIRTLAGRPLLYWSARAAAACGAVSEVYVATDDDAIARTVRGLAMEKVAPITRASKTATDTASTESVMLDFAARVEFDVLVLIQATSPLLTPAELDEGLALLDSGAADSVVSVVRQKRFLWQADGGVLVSPANYDPQARPRRQDFEGFLVENGAFYITRREALLATGCRLNGRVGHVEMPSDTYHELDEPGDWEIVEGLLAQRLRALAPPLRTRLDGIKLVATDVDGCLTDAGMYYGEQGDELKKFCTRDGMGFRMLQKKGFLTAIITGEAVDLVARRGKKLGVDEVHRGIQDKVATMEGILERHGLNWEEVAFLGDDLNDVDLIRRVGVSACPADACRAVRRIADIRLRRKGGEGVFRELVELILGD